MSEESGSSPEIGFPMRPFEEVEHTADTALLVRGSDLSGLLQNAALGMNRILVAGATTSPNNVSRTIVLDAIDREDLLVEWLSELLFWAETERILFNDFEFHELTPVGLRATIRGAEVSRLDTPIKAVTFHNLVINSSEQGLTATVIFDI